MNSIKTVLSVIVYYIALCIFGTLAVALLVMAYFGCLRFVVGSDLVLFSMHSFLIGIKIGFPIILILCPMFVILFLLRHSKKNKIIGISTLFILTCLSCLLIIPLFIKHSTKIQELKVLEKSKISTGYFRLYDNGLYYFSNVNDNKKANGIFIDVNQLSTAESFYVFENLDISNLDNSKFSDDIVKQLIEFPKVLDNLFSNSLKLWNQAKKSFLTSMKSWLFFCSFWLALFCVFLVSDISKWRLVNVCYVLVSTFCILNLNMVGYGICGVDKVNQFFNNTNLKLKSLNFIFSGIDFPICFVINVLFILVFLILGLIFMIKNKSKNEE